MENFQGGLQVYLKRTPLQMFPKVAGKFPKKKLKQPTKIQRYSIKFFTQIPRLPNGRSFNDKLLS